MSDDCAGCSKPLNVEAKVYTHERFGLLCGPCYRFALACDVEIARLREWAEVLSVLESAMNPRAVVN